MLWKKIEGSLSEQTYVSLDIETTGIDFVRDRVIEIGLVKWRKNRKREKFHSLFKVDIPISQHSFSVHGITNSALKNAPYFHEMAGKIEDFLKDSIIIGFNYLSLDFSMLNKELRLAGRTPVYNPFIDVQCVSRAVFDGIPKSIGLTRLARKLNIEVGTSHRALPDALLAMKIWLKIMDKLEALGIKTISDFLESRYYNFKVMPKVAEIFKIAWEKGEVTIRYNSPYNGKMLRVIEPLAFRGRKIDAYCHVREDFRSFTVDRIIEYW